MMLHFTDLGASDSFDDNDHLWGVYPSVDRVWAQVSGLPPMSARARLLMVLQAFIDDSSDAESYVLAGFIAPAHKWANFAKEWNELLPLCTFDKYGHRRFKMNEIMQRSDWQWIVGAFYKVIEENVICAISTSIKLSDINAARNRVIYKGNTVNWKEIKNSYASNFQRLAFYLILNKTANRSGGAIERIPREPVDFYFDTHSDYAGICAEWDAYTSRLSDEARKMWGSRPRFEDDTRFLPLQAADLWAWCIRDWVSNGSPINIIPSMNVINAINTKKEAFPKQHIWISQDELTSLFMMAVSDRSTNICDVQDRKRIIPSYRFGPLLH